MKKVPGEKKQNKTNKTPHPTTFTFGAWQSRFSTFLEVVSQRIKDPSIGCIPVK